MHLSFQGADRLVVLHHLNGRYGFGRHILRSLVVLVAHQVQPLNIHLIDTVALIHNLSGGQHFDARHVLEHVLDAVVFLLAERLHMVIERIFLAGDGVGLGQHFDARHVLEHVLDAVVFLLAERLHMVIERIFLAGDGVGLDHHFVYGVGLFDELHVIAQLILYYWNALRGKTHFGKG